MGIVVSTDVFCDECSNWGHHETGKKSDITGAKNKAKKDGWTLKKTDELVDLICPACNGSKPDYWKPWFKGSRCLQ